MFKESRSFDLSVLGNTSPDEGKQKGVPKVFQCSFDTEDTLLGDVKAHSKDALTDDHNLGFQTENLLNQMKLSNAHSR